MTVPHTEVDIVVSRDLTIEGLSSMNTVVQAAASPGSAPGRVITVAGGVEVTFKRLTIRHGNTGNPGGGIYNDGGTVTLLDVDVLENNAGDGGGIYNAGTMRMTGGQVNGNVSAQDGGGIYNSGALWSDGVEVQGNQGDNGGGLYQRQGNLTVSDSHLVSNAVNGDGGGISYDGNSLTLDASTVHVNSGAGGGGMSVFAAGADVANTTISGNQADQDGGGILVVTVLAEARLANVTVADNTADSDGDGNGHGGGLFVESSSAARIRNSLIAGNHDLSAGSFARAPDCRGTVTSDEYNLIGDLGTAINGTHCIVTGDTTGNLIGASAELGPLQDNGGPTLTHALLPSSPALNGGNPAGCLG